MNKLVAEIKAATQAEAAKAAGGGATYDYNSDEETEGGTWEHKLRMQEMMKTYKKARELTLANQGKHHIGDFLPPKELEKFIEKVGAIKEGRTPGERSFMMWTILLDSPSPLLPRFLPLSLSFYSF